MLSNASLAGVLVSSVIGTAVLVTAVVIRWTRVQHREAVVEESSKIFRRVHDADLMTVPYDLESELLDDQTGLEDHLDIELTYLFDKVETCAHRHFPQGKARTSQHDPVTEVQLEDMEAAMGQLDAKKFVSLLRDPQNRPLAVQHFIVSSICAALNIRGGDKRNLVQQDYTSFVQSLKTYTPQCRWIMLLCLTDTD